MPYYIGKAVDHCEFDIKADCFILRFNEGLLAQWKRRGDMLREINEKCTELFCGSFRGLQEHVTFFINPINPFLDDPTIPEDVRSVLIQVDETSECFILDDLPLFLKISLNKEENKLRDKLISDIDCVMQKFFFPFPDNNELMFTISGYVKNTDILLESEMQISISFLEKALADKEFGRWKE